MTWMDNKSKILYFRYFYGGREDVYAFRVPQGGYRPRRRKRYNLTDALIISHMQGKVMLGAYPLMRDGTTRWVAADFDGKNNNAFEEARALSEALRSYDIETLCNTSQSGNGVHVRVIFEGYVPAWFARNLMKAFIEKEGIRKIADGGAFDRLFPTQDELTIDDNSAIGNQIAMPLHMGAAKSRGGSMLLDNEFKPIPLGDETWDAIELYDRVKRVSIGDALQNINRYDLLLTGPERLRRALERSLPPPPQPSHNRNKSEGGRRRDRNAADLKKMVEECEFMRYANQGRVEYFEWIALASNFAQFDAVGGRRFFHIASRDDERYDYEQTEKKYDNILRSFNAPITCRKIAQEGWSCPMLGSDGQCDKFRDAYGRGPRAPAAIPFFVEKEEAA